MAQKIYDFEEEKEKKTEATKSDNVDNTDDVNKADTEEHTVNPFVMFANYIKSEDRRYDHTFFNTCMFVFQLIIIYAVICASLSLLISNVIPSIGMYIISATCVSATASSWSATALYTMPYFFLMILLAALYITLFKYMFKYVNKARKKICALHKTNSDIRIRRRLRKKEEKKQQKKSKYKHNQK